MNNLLSTFSKYTKNIRYGARLQPVRDWVVLVSLTIVLVLVSVAWNIWLFYESEHGKVVGTMASTSSEVFTPIPISSVQTVFKARATQESGYQNAYTFVDPSTQN